VQSDPAQPQQGMRRPVIAIAFFYVIALGLSFAAAQLPPTDVVAGFRVDHGLLIGLGPLIATVIACLVLRQRFPSLFGHALPIGLLALLVPIVLVAFTGFGGIAAAGIPGLVFGASIVVYCLCEEAGWRGFLTTNLSWMKEWHADLLSGGLWFGWHFTFMPELYDPSYTMGFVAAILAGAFGLAATRRFTGGFALATGWHAAVKLFPIGPLAFGLIALLAVLTWQAKKASAAK
jgi:membrane protease YdiL (CAAX protease family)